MTRVGQELLPHCSPATTVERRRDLRLAGACLAWALCFVGARWLIRDGPWSDGAVVWLVATLPTAAGLGLLIVFTRYLREIDELQRSIQLQAMALGFGGGFLAICGYVTFQPLGAPQIDPVSLLAVMPILYAVGILLGSGRYR
jgi:hypothetical protein